MGSRSISLLLGLLLLSTELLAEQNRGICSLPPDDGLGYANMKFFYYDAKKKICKTFTYGGVGGNENRFKSRMGCERACMKQEWKK